MTDPSALAGRTESVDTSDPADVHTVLVVAKSHLDVGFTDLAGAVRERWLREHLPAATETARELRGRGGEERLCWTVGSWIIHEALEEPDQQLRAAVEHAIGEGELVWHALPFTTHTELADRSLLEHGLSISARLDDWFGRATRAAKLTDVPGHTRAIVSLLAGAGVDLLHVGVNPAAACPDVPDLFRWRDGSAAGSPEITTMYQDGAYGSCRVVPGTGTAVSIWMRGDNDGPPGVADVLEHWEGLRSAFPGATLRAASLDDVADLLRPLAGTIPVLTAEIGDTWIHGVGADPSKTAAFRETCRRRRGWIESGLVAADDPVLARASTELLLVAEHTWGLDQKLHWPDTEHWSESALASVRPQPATRRFEWSWSEQRAYLDRFLDLLERGGRVELAADAREGMLATGVAAVEVDGLVAHERPSGGGPIEVSVGTALIAIDPHDGALISLRVPGVDEAGAPVWRELVAEGRSIGRVGHRTYDADDFARRFSTYNAGVRPVDVEWATWDNTKPGLERSGARSAWYAPDLVGVWSGRRETSADGPDGADVLILELSFSDEVRAASAAPYWVLVGYEWRAGAPTELSCWLQWHGKPAARWPESTWWSFVPAVDDPTAWTMTKLGELVDPLDVVSRGARNLHAVESVQHPDGVHILAPDAPLVSPGRPSVMRFEDELPELAGGWHVCLYDNIWGTNFPMWCPGDARFRLTLGW